MRFSCQKLRSTDPSIHNPANKYNRCCLRQLDGTRETPVEKSLAQIKEREKYQKNELNAPNGSRDIALQSQEFEQDGRRNLVDF